MGRFPSLSIESTTAGFWERSRPTTPGEAGIINKQQYEKICANEHNVHFRGLVTYLAYRHFPKQNEEECGLDDLWR